ncbi:MAG: DUF2062 domain-containing protein [Alphaproteobacteria bacterium]
MFKRRKPLTLIESSRELFWPSMGWKRAAYYTKHRLLRIADTTHSIALGLAIGTGVSFSPLLGTHFIQAAILAFILRANPLAAMMGTFAGNPWTFPFIWWAGFSLGCFLFSAFGIEGPRELPDELSFSVMWEIAKTHPLDLFLPWMLGGYIMLFLMIIPAYIIYYQLVRAAKKAKARAKALAIEKRKAECQKKEYLKKARLKVCNLAKKSAVPKFFEINPRTKTIIKKQRAQQ